MSDPIVKDNLAKIDWDKIEAHRHERCLPEHHARAILANNLPRVLPADWREIERGNDGRKYGRTNGMTFIVSVAREDDGKEWLHFSVAHPTRMLTYDEMVEVKELFCGRDNKAIFILPPRAQHINVHRNCLHFFRCLDSDGLPDFTGGTNSL
jgi:hypothetical protein